MKYIFFLIIPLLLVPSLVYGEVGKNFDTVRNPDGTTTWTSHFERILDSDWKYVDYIFTDEPNFLQVETASGSIRVDKNSCEFSFYSPGIIGGKTPILIDDITPFQSVNGSGIFNKVTALDNATCQTAWINNTLKAIKNVSGLGSLRYSYEFTGTSWKTELRVTNLSGLNDRLFGFEETFDLNRDTVKFGGSQKNLDNLDGSVFDRIFLENNQARVIDLLNGHTFDFDLGFDKLNRVWINDTGKDSSLLTFQYFHNQTILSNGATLIIDPTFTSNNPVIDEQIQETDNDGLCENTGAVYLGVGGNAVDVGIFQASSGSDCTRGIAEWDITSIPDTANIQNVDLGFEITLIEGTGVVSCDYIGLDDQPSVASDIIIFRAIGEDTVLLAADTACDSVGANRSLGMGSAGITYITAQLASDWAAIGIRMTDDTITAQTASQQITNFASEELPGTPNLTLTIVYNNPSAVLDLISTDTRATGIDLSWSTPGLSGGSVDGYQINNTTPHSENVATVLTNNTNSAITTYTVQGLTGSTDYSFRVGIWLTNGGNNMSGNVLNITTVLDPTATFTPGTFNLTDTGVDIRDIRFEEITISPTSTRLNVTYSNTFDDLECDLSYQFLLQNRTYSNLNSTALSGSELGFNETTFLFTNVQNEIITAYCWNDTPQGNGTYVITQTSIPFVNQIKQFQAGDFGTLGSFGAIDLVTLLVFGAVATIGFNRSNEAVAAIFLFFLTFGLAYFEIITLPTAMGGIIAVVILLVIMTVRKD